MTDPVQVTIDSGDVEAIAKLVYWEAHNIKLDYETFLSGIGVASLEAEQLASTIAYGSIIDVIINRIASESANYGTDVQEVTDKRSGNPIDGYVYQFSALDDHNVEHAIDLPTFGSYNDVETFVTSYLTARAQGQGSIVENATHYYNPNISDPNWGPLLKTKLDIGLDEDEHLFGNLPGTDPLPKQYELHYGSDSFEFTPHLAPIPRQKPIPLLNGPTEGSWGEPLPTQIASDIQPTFDLAQVQTSPLVIDLSIAHSGVTLTTWNASTTTTFFDLYDNDFAVQTAWISGDTGLLARDLDSSGTIDSSAELFGSPTVDGFAILSLMDTNHDLRIDANDTDFSTLVVWTDTDGDAVTDTGELHSLASLGIKSIDLASVAASTSTISGNPISHVSTVTFTSGATAAIADAWFVTDTTNSYYVGDYTLDAEALFLPTVRGYGTLPDLAIAISQDSDLKDLVSDFVANFSLESLADPEEFKETLTEILYAWAGVAEVDPNGRGQWVDGQHLAFLEKFMGRDFVNFAGGSSAGAWGGFFLEAAYHKAFDMIAADLMVQMGAAQLFDGPVTYNPFTGIFDGDTALSETAIGELVAIAPSPGTDNVGFWELVARFIDITHGIDNLTVNEVDWLDDAVNASDSSLHWDDIAALLSDDNLGNTTTGTSGDDTISGTDYNDTLSGAGGNDTIHGYAGLDVIYGDGGADTLYGDANADQLYGGNGNDILYGGQGNDRLYGENDNDELHGETGGNILNGGAGNDTYVYGDGSDLILESSGTDQIVMSTGVVAGDLTFSRVSTSNSMSTFNDLLIEIDGSGTIQIEQFFYSSIYKVESILFSDTSTLDLTTLALPDVYGTPGNDTISVSGSGNFDLYGGMGDDYLYTIHSGNHTFSGGLGNDILRGNTGNDVYIASEGFDNIQESGGTDQIIVPIGFTLSDLTFYRILGPSGPTNDLGITILGLGEIKIDGHFNGSSGAVESIYFLEDSSTVSLTNRSITTVGTAGNNTLNAPSANAGPDDIFDGREGNDNLNGGLGNDIYIFSAGNDRIDESAGGGDDTIRVREIYDPSDITIAFVQDTANNNNYNMQLTDTDGNTITVYRQGYSATNVIEHVAFANGTTWHLNSMELTSYGTSGNDSIAGHNYGDASSNDTIYALAGNDSINAGDGDDVIYAGDGNDYVSTSSGTDTIYGGDGSDDLHGNGYDVLYGDDGNDYLYSQPLSGEAGTTLVTLYGGSGTDALYGGNYGQTIENGGAGADTIVCGSGIDTVMFSSDAFGSVDTVQSFNAANDKLDISDILDGYYDPGTDVLTDFVQIITNGSNSELRVDVTGTATFGTGQHIATIQGVTGLTDEAALVTAGTLIAA